MTTISAGRVGVVVVEGGRGVMDGQALAELDGQLGGERLGTCLGRLTPVLPQVELAVAVEVLERVAVHLDDVHASAVGVAERGRTVLGDLGPPVLHRLARPLRLDGVTVRIDGIRAGVRCLLARRRARATVGRRATASERRKHPDCRRTLQEVPSRNVRHCPSSIRQDGRTWH